MSFQPTDEQQAIIDACGTGKNLVIEAGAGAGKTATMKLAAENLPGTGLYAAFNKAIADEAKSKFPQNTTARTIHSLAFASVGKHFKHRLNGPRQSSKDVALKLGLLEPLKLGKDFTLQPGQQARLAIDAVERFCNSDDSELRPKHVPKLNGLEEGQTAALREFVEPFAREIWEDLKKPDGTRFKFTHGCYLKIFALGRPTLPYDFILLDEAQDTNPVTAGLILSQTQAQLLAVGDPAQAIYEWRGAVNAMETWPADQRLRLSRSFRFGQQIADEGNKWLYMLSTDMRISGTGTSTVGALAHADAVLCRTNGGAVGEVLSAQRQNRRVALVGGGQQIKQLAQACDDLKYGKGTSHPELVAFKSWEDVREYVSNDSTGSDLKAFVRLIDTFGTGLVIAAMDQLADERRADVTVSTAHKGKGREWPRVRIGNDFTEPLDEEGNPLPVPKEEARLAYVAVTRGKEHVDVGGLSWVNDRLERERAKKEAAAVE